MRLYAIQCPAHIWQPLSWEHRKSIWPCFINLHVYFLGYHSCLPYYMPQSGTESLWFDSRRSRILRRVHGCWVSLNSYPNISHSNTLLSGSWIHWWVNNVFHLWLAILNIFRSSMMRSMLTSPGRSSLSFAQFLFSYLAWFFSRTRSPSPNRMATWVATHK